MTGDERIFPATYKTTRITVHTNAVLKRTEPACVLKSLKNSFAEIFPLYLPPPAAFL